MAVNLSFIGGAGWQFFDNNGVPLAGGKIYTYAAGTTTPLATYTSRSGTVANANPIILDAAGRTPAQIWSTEGLLYKYVVADANNVTLRTWDNIGGSVVASDLAQDLANTTDNTKGDALIGFKQSNSAGFLSGAVARTVNTKLQEIISVKDFGAVGDASTDDTAAIQAALNALNVNGGGTLYFPLGTYMITSTLQVYSNTCITGDGPGSVIKSNNMSITAGAWPFGNQTLLVMDGVSNVIVENICLDISGITNFLTATRAILANNTSYLWVQNCKILTSGAATACTACNNYYIVNNDVYVSSTDGIGHHDGIIDSWWGSHTFTIDGNTINNNISDLRYAILVTGQTNALAAAACHHFTIVNNKIYDVDAVGIWINGRNGQNYCGIIANNQIENVASFYGIDVQDTTDCIVANNIIRNTYLTGIFVGSENNVSYAGAQNVTVSNNVINNPSTSAGVSPLYNSGIAFDKAANCVASANVVFGSTYRYGVIFSASSSNGRELGGQYTGAVVSPPVASFSSTSYPSYGFYTATKTAVSNVSASLYGQSNYFVVGNIVTVNFLVGITTTAGGSASTVLRFSLPIATDLNTDPSLYGAANTSSGQVASVTPDTTNDAALITFPAPSIGTFVFYGTFSYRIT